jgi:Protein of unknown function (DUF4241)
MDLRLKSTHILITGATRGVGRESALPTFFNRRHFLSLALLGVATATTSCSTKDPLAPPDYVKAFELAFKPGFSWPDDLDHNKRVPFEVIDGGFLTITSGEIVAADPFVFLERPAFTQKVPIGRHPVRFAHARVHGAAGGRIEFARVDFSTKPITRWQMAVIPENDPATLKPGYIFGYPVDAGTGCFLDRQASVTVTAELAAKTRPENFTEAWINDGDTAGKAKGLTFYLDVPVPPHNIVMFESGWGDGYYASYFGYAADGSVVSLLTDFQVMDWSLEKLP